MSDITDNTDTQEIEDVEVPTVEQKTENSTAAYARRQKEENATLKKELEAYKRREEDAKRAAMTELERIQAERDLYKMEAEATKLANLKNRIITEKKLPASFADRLSGSDEESLRADAESLVELLTEFKGPVKVGNVTNPARNETGKPKIYSRSELAKDMTLALSEEVKIAQREGRISDD